MVDKGIFGFDEQDVARWTPRQTGHALRPILAKIAQLSKSGAEAQEIRSHIESDKDALVGLAHLNELMRETTR